MMNTKDLKEQWNSFKEKKGLLRRLDPTHPMDFFIGVNEKGNDELALFTINEPAQMKSSEALEVEKNVRKDGRWATQISSIDKNNEDIFSSLCLDLLQVSYNASSEQEGLDRVIGRFVAWQKLFANLKNDLPMSILKGLIGELCFLKNISSRIGWNKAIEAWLGPEGADRDFVLDKSWYEIKSISSGKDKITISSLNQLESQQDGFLIVFRVDESSATDSLSENIVDLINQIKHMLENEPLLLQKFENKLLKLGYLNKKTYEELFFRIGEPEYYCVNKSFPKLITSSVPVEIVSAKYDLSIAGISKWKTREETLWN